MTGFVCVLGDHQDPHAVAAETEALAAAYSALRPRVPRGPLAEQRAAGSTGCLVGFGVDAQCDDRGWTVRHGVLHGPTPHPMSAADVPPLDGQGCVASFDTATGTAVVATDRFAGAPLYTARRPGLLYVSTSAMALARHLRAPANPAGVAAFLASGNQFGEVTHWEGIERMLPGTLLEVHGERVVEREYWRPQRIEEVERLGFAQAVDRVIEVATETYRQRLSSIEPWIDLTGGYDSRLMALLLEHAGVRFRANTRASAPGPDVDRAGEIAALTGWPWETVWVPDDWPRRLPDLVDHALAAADGRLEVLQLSRVAEAHRRIAQVSPYLLSGGGGEHLQFTPWKTEFARPFARRPSIGLWVDTVGVKSQGPGVLAHGVRDQVRAATVDRLTRWTLPYESEPKTRRLDAVYAYKSMGHFSAYRAADDQDIVAQLPFYFEPVFSTAFSLRARHRSNFRLMRAVIHRLNPQVAALETTRGGPATPMRPSTIHRYLPLYGQLARRGYNKLTERIVGRPLWPFPTPHSRTLDDANAAVVARLRERGLLDWDGLRCRPLLSAQGVELLRTGATSADTLGRVLTVELALDATGAQL